jgi:hypothetical protein
MSNPNDEIGKDKTYISRNQPTDISHNVRDAGKFIKKSVTSHILYVACFTLGTFLNMFALFSAISDIMSGQSIGRIMHNSPSFILTFVFYIAGFIFWVSSLVRMYKAGELLDTSDSSRANH